MPVFLYVAAAVTFAIGVYHLFFWRLFRWKSELAKLKPVNRGAMQVFNLCITLLFFGLTYLLIAYSEALLASPLGRAMLIFLAIFWLFRAALQPVFFGGWTRATFGYVALLATLSALHVLPLVLPAA